MLIRSISVSNGLCNGTRLMVEELKPNLILARILSGDHEGELAFIHRVTLCCDDVYPFDLHRHQFPIVLAFAMTIIKLQGQTLDALGIDLRKNVFGHGQLYTALSRVRHWEALKIRLDEKNIERKVKNIVFTELLDEYD